jgi:hypothetical protein
VRVTNERTAQGQQVVQRVGGVLGHAQRPVPREVEVHLGGSLGARRHLELDLDAVDRVGLAGLAHVDRRHDHPDLTARRRLAQSRTDLPFRTLRQDSPVHVSRAASHRGAGVHVLGDRVLDEALWRDHGDPAGFDLGDGCHAEHAPEMIDVTVRVDDGHHWAVTSVRAIQAECGRRRLGRDERVDDDHACVALDECDVREVEPARLVDAGRDLVEALPCHELRLSPEARVHRRRSIARQEPVRSGIPHDTTVISVDDRRLERAEESAVGVFHVLHVVERQRTEQRPVRRLDGFACRLRHGPLPR